MQRMLIAGVGNIFLGDDGFGVEVTRCLAATPVPEWVRVADFGIRGLHLAYEMLDGAYETTVLVDATARGGTPGTVYLIEPDQSKPSGAAADLHGMDPQAVLAMVASLGGTPGRVLIVGCEPANVDEGVGLSEPVSAAVREAVRLVQELIGREDERRKRRGSSGLPPLGPSRVLAFEDHSAKACPDVPAVDPKRS